MIVSWTNYNITHFFIATLLARKIRERGIDIVPFGISYAKLRSIMNKRAFIVSTFERDEIDMLSNTRKNTVVIVKILSKRIERPTRIGKLYIIPVPRRNMYGLEYITSINMYTPYNISLEEFKVLNDNKQEIALVLPVIDKFPEFLLELSVPEIPLTRKYVREKLNEFKEKYRFNELYSYYVKKLKGSIVKETSKYIILYVDGEPLKKFSVLVEKIFPGKTVVLLGKNRYRYKALIVSDKIVKIRNISGIDGYVIGGGRKLSLVMDRRNGAFSKIVHIIESVIA